MPKYQLAQFNIGRPLYELDDPRMAEFMDNLDRINTLAENHPGFIWRLTGDNGNATEFEIFGDAKLISNLTIWKDVAALKDYVYNSDHLYFLKARKQWFEAPREAIMVLWWVPAGYHPTLQEAEQKLTLLRQQGSSAEAFTPHKPFPAPGTAIA
ncbi:MAG: DUF3291 domain-containing protein [Marinobacterium sp.]|nr:DUF3291 domain-containing protein [Marinobacterium sp.]